VTVHSYQEKIVREIDKHTYSDQVILSKICSEVSNANTQVKEKIFHDLCEILNQENPTLLGVKVKFNVSDGIAKCLVFI